MYTAENKILNGGKEKMPKTSTDEEAIGKVYEALMNHLGRLNAVSTKDLAEEAGMKFKSELGPNMRAIIRGVKRDYRLPIGSCTKGYYVICSKPDLVNWVKEQKAQRDSIDRNIREIWQYFHELDVSIKK